MERIVHVISKMLCGRSDLQVFGKKPLRHAQNANSWPLPMYPTALLRRSATI